MTCRAGSRPGSSGAPRSGQARRTQAGQAAGRAGGVDGWEVPDRTEDHYPEGACACGADLAGAADLGVARSFQQLEVPEPSAQRIQHDLQCATRRC